MGIEKIPLRIPEKWSAEWFQEFILRVLAPADTRNAIGEGIVVSADGNSPATLSATAAIDAAIATHDALETAHVAAIGVHDVLADAHEVAFDAHRAETDPHPDLIDDLTAATSVALTDIAMVSQAGTNRRATVEQVRDIVFGDDWTDLVVPAVAINPLGAPAAPSLNANTGCLEFSATIDNVIILTWQMPHGWSSHYDATKGVVVPHLHVRHLSSTAAPNNVSRWKCEYDVADPFGSFTSAYASWTTMTTVSVTNPADTKVCGLIDLGDLDLGAYGASAILHCKISRLANSDGADTDSSVIAVYSADLHYQTRTAGSENELPS